MTSLSQMIEGLLLRGCQRHLVNAALELDWPTDPKPTKEEIDAAYAECLDAWIRNAGEDKEKIHAFHIRTRMYLYQKSHTLNDFKTCLAILKDLAALQRAYEHQTKAREKADEENSEVNKLLTVIHGGRDIAHDNPARKALGGRRRRTPKSAND
jgi:hypothetical protein